MPTLDPHGFNFITRFPVPNDARMHRAGRQGMLDKKEDRALSDAQWIACQHEALGERADRHAPARALAGHWRTTSTRPARRRRGTASAGR